MSDAGTGIPLAGFTCPYFVSVDGAKRRKDRSGWSFWSLALGRYEIQFTYQGGRLWRAAEHAIDVERTEGTPVVRLPYGSPLLAGGDVKILT